MPNRRKNGENRLEILLVRKLVFANSIFNIFLIYQWAHSILLLEQSFGPEELKGFQNRYCMALPDPDPTKPDRPVLMVIKKINSTKALVNRRTMGLWKVDFCLIRKKSLKNKTKDYFNLDIDKGSTKRA